jgi:hypothetical protein
LKYRTSVEDSATDRKLGFVAQLATRRPCGPTAINSGSIRSSSYSWDQFGSWLIDN